MKIDLRSISSSNYRTAIDNIIMMLESSIYYNFDNYASGVTDNIFMHSDTVTQLQKNLTDSYESVIDRITKELISSRSFNPVQQIDKFLATCR